jgi:hypothetical protein
MGQRHPNPNRIKVHRSYTIRELAELYGLHPHTVRGWQRGGLEPIDKLKPVLFHGEVLRAFLQARRAKAKRPCPPGHIHCLACRAPKPLIAGLVEYIPTTATHGNLRALCPDCGRLMNQAISKERAAELERKLATFTEGESHIRDGTSPPVNCDFERGE